MGAVTLYGFGFLGWLLIALFAKDVSFLELVKAGSPILVQTMMGIILGVASFLIINVFIQSKLLDDLTHYIYDLARQLTWLDIFFLSVCAGVGEELLFRVGIQHFIGVWPTAFVFILLHGYFSLSDWRVTLYGLFMTLISAGFGILYLKYGIASAMIAHFLIDFIILSMLKLRQKKMRT